MTEAITDVELRPTSCAICGTFERGTEKYPANFLPDAFNAAVFSARRLPDRIHYRMVECNTCGLLRSDPVADHGVMRKLYQQSTFDYGSEVAALKATYGRYLVKCLGRNGRGFGSLLEVGCGNGFLLEEALERGFEQVKGIEPGSEAVAKGADHIRPHLVEDILRPGLIEPVSFDSIAMFQVFDHLPEPAAALDECLKILKPGGRLLLLNHNVSALSARILGERSPIIDIEHTYLYNPKTLRKLVEARGYVYETSGSVWNGYSLQYISRLLPMPKSLKLGVLKLLEATGLGRIPLRVPLGNLYLVARKP